MHNFSFEAAFFSLYLLGASLMMKTLFFAGFNMFSHRGIFSWFFCLVFLEFLRCVWPEIRSEKPKNDRQRRQKWDNYLLYFELCNPWFDICYQEHKNLCRAYEQTIRLGEVLNENWRKAKPREEREGEKNWAVGEESHIKRFC